MNGPAIAARRRPNAQTGNRRNFRAQSGLQASLPKAPGRDDFRLSAHPDLVVGRQLDFLAIVAGAGAVDDEEIALGVEDEQEVVPDALVDSGRPDAPRRGTAGPWRDRNRPPAPPRRGKAARSAARSSGCPADGARTSCSTSSASGRARNRLITPAPPLVGDVDLGEPVVADGVALVDVQLHGLVARPRSRCRTARRPRRSAARASVRASAFASLQLHLAGCARHEAPFHPAGLIGGAFDRG